MKGLRCDMVSYTSIENSRMTHMVVTKVKLNECRIWIEENPNFIQAQDVYKKPINIIHFHLKRVNKLRA